MTRFSHYFVIALLSIMSTDLLAEVRSGNLECQFYLFGEISMADADALATSDCGFALLSLANSPGGDVHAAMVIGRWLRERNATVNVQIDSFCYSSCALVYISGISRANFGEIGLHRPYLVGLPRSQNEVRIAVERMHTQLIAYVSEMGVRPEFSSAMINTPPDQMKIYRHDAINSLVPTDDPLHDELRTAFSARRFGLSTEEYRRRNAEAESSCFSGSLAHGDTPLNCMDAILWGLSVSVFRQRASLAESRCTQLNDVEEEEVRAWQAAGNHWTDHPLAVEHQRCRLEIMLGR